MPDGEMRRPPQLWEQRLTRLTSVLSVGMSSSGATSIVEPTPAPGADSGVEPAPVLPPPDDFVAPSQPTLIGSVQGINVVWDGLNSVGDLWPYDTSYVEVHMSTSGPTFTPGSATLKGRLDRPGAFYVGGLTAGSTYYFRLRGADPAGNVTDPSDAASGLTGLTTAGDYGTATIGSGAVSFDARTIGGVANTVGSVEPSNPIQGDVWLDSSPGTAIIHKIYNGSSWVTNAWGSASIAAGQISALQIAAGAVTAGAIAAGAVTTDKLTAGTISGFYISGGTIAGGYITGGTMNAGYLNGGTISGGYISGGTIDGASLRTASSGARVEMGAAFSSLSAVSLYNSSGLAGAVLTNIGSGLAVVAQTGTPLFLNGSKVDVNPPLECTSDIIGDAGLSIAGQAVDMAGVYANNTTGIDQVGIGASNSRLRRISSSQAIKYDIATLTGELSDSVEPARLCDVSTVDPQSVLDVAVTEFSVIDDGEPTERRVLGFIADDVADKLPIAATYYPDGTAAGVQTDAMVAALLAVVQDQQATITALTARIEALEA